MKRSRQAHRGLLVGQGVAYPQVGVTISGKGNQTLDTLSTIVTRRMQVWRWGGGSVLLLLSCLVVAPTVEAAEHYVIAQQKSQVQFKAYSLLAKPVGNFRTFSGEIVADAQQVGASQVRVVIDAVSIDTDNTKRDKHLRSEDFLFVASYPTITFVSTAITQDGTAYLVQGNLTMRGVTRPLTVPVMVEQRPNEIAVRGVFRLNRSDFGVTYNSTLNPVEERIDITFTFVGVKS